VSSLIPIIGSTLFKITENIDGRSTDVVYSSEPNLFLSSNPGDLGSFIATPEYKNDLWIFADKLTIRNRVWLPGKQIKIVANRIVFDAGSSLSVDGRAGENPYGDSDAPRPCAIGDAGANRRDGYITERSEYMVGTRYSAEKGEDGDSARFTEANAYARNGVDGESAGKIELYFEMHEGSIDVSACGASGTRGEAGRSGAQGGNGGRGVAREISSRTSDGWDYAFVHFGKPGAPGKGGDATPGGKGGNGGNGGTIIVRSLETQRPINAAVLPGSKGKNGPNGIPGNGGSTPAFFFQGSSEVRNTRTYDIPEQHGAPGSLRPSRDNVPDPKDGALGSQVNSSCTALEFLRQCNVVHLGMIWERIQGVALMLDIRAVNFDIAKSEIGRQTLWLNGLLKHFKDSEFDETTAALLDALRRDVAAFVANIARHRDVFGNEQDWVPAGSTYFTERRIDSLMPQLQGLEKTYKDALADVSKATQLAASARDAFAQLDAARAWLTERMDALRKDVARTYDAVARADDVVQVRRLDFEHKGSEPLQKAIYKKFDLDFGAFLRAFTNMAFAPPYEPSHGKAPGGASPAGLAMAGISLTEALHESSQTIVDQATGQRLDKGYLISQVREISDDIVGGLSSVAQSVDGLLEDGTRAVIAVSTPQVQRLIKTVSDLPEAAEYLRDFNLFVDAAIARSNVITQYNSYVVELLETHAQLQDVKAGVKKELGNEQDSSYMVRQRQLAWTALTYRRMRKTVLQQLSALNQDYCLWALDDYNVFATVLNPGRQLVDSNIAGEINAAVIEQCRVDLQEKYFASIEQNYGSDRYKKLPDRLGDALRINKEEHPELIKTFVETGEISFTLCPTDKDGNMLGLSGSEASRPTTNIANRVTIDAFNRRAFNRLLLVRPFLTGATLRKGAITALGQGVDYFEIDAVHACDNWFQDRVGKLHRYRHPVSRTFTFSYFDVPPFKHGDEQYVYNPGFFADEASPGGAVMAMAAINQIYDPKARNVMVDGQEYVGIGPFGDWTLRLRTPKKFVLLENLSEIVVDFHTSAYKL
jgi:hypothetical protein